jgi:hypothetical protein
MEIPKSRLFLLAVGGLSAALFLPLMGHGFIHDDFIHLHSVAYQSIWHGLTRANGGPFYAPMAWLTFKFDWLLWGKSPFMMAVGNLLLHVSNITLLYAFVLTLWRSQTAARWAALGFALLFPANTWAVMWIATRAHLLATLFYLATLIATARLARAERHRKSAIMAVILFATLSMFSKESGVTAPLAVAITLIYFRRSGEGKRLPPAQIIWLFGSLIAALAVYAIIRGRSGAISITFSASGWYSYAMSPRILTENLLRYGWRTYGLLGIMACAIACSQIIRRRRPRLCSSLISDALLSAALFVIAIAPFILIRGRSGIYTYLPGIAAALLLGATARAFYEAPLRYGRRDGEKEGRLYGEAEGRKGGEKERKAALQIRSLPVSPSLRLSVLPPHHLRGRFFNLLATSPILLVIALYSLLTVVHSLKWIRMAEINTFVLNRIAKQVINPQPNTLFVLTYSEVDSVHKFPDGLAPGFSCALRMIYANPTLNGLIERQSESRHMNFQAPVIRLTYLLSHDGAPQLVVSSDEADVH